MTKKPLRLEAGACWCKVRWLCIHECPGAPGSRVAGGKKALQDETSRPIWQQEGPAEPQTAIQSSIYWKLHGVFPHTKVPSLTDASLLKESFTCPVTLVLYYASFTTHKMQDVSEASCDQNHGMAAMPLQLNDRCFPQGFFEAKVLLKHSCSFLCLARYSDSAKFLQ